MKSLKLPALLCVVLASAVMPGRVSALAGIAEHYDTYHFNQFAWLVQVHPGDVCRGSDKHCLVLRSVEPSRRNFEKLEGSLEAINVPSDPSSPYVIAQWSHDDSWFVYDLGEQRHLVEGATLDEAVSEWLKLGQTNPAFIDAHNTEEHLEETSDSFWSRWTFQVVWIAAGLVIPSFVLLLIFGGLYKAFQRGYRNSGSQVKLALARIFMIPAGLCGIVLVLSVGLLVTLRLLEL